MNTIYVIRQKPGINPPLTWYAEKVQATYEGKIVVVVKDLYVPLLEAMTDLAVLAIGEKHTIGANIDHPIFVMDLNGPTPYEKVEEMFNNAGFQKKIVELIDAVLESRKDQIIKI